MYCLLIYISVEFKLSLNVTHHFTWYSLEMNLWANASICSDAMKTLFPKSLKKSAKADLLRGLLCVPPHRPLWRHWCYPEGWTRAPRRPPAAAAAEMWVAAHCGQRRCNYRAQLCRTYAPHCSQAPTVSWFPRPDLAGPCLGGSPPLGTNCFLIAKLFGRQLGILHTVFWVEHKSQQALGSPGA